MFAIVDLETTGGSAARDRITEVEARLGEEVAESNAKASALADELRADRERRRKKDEEARKWLEQALEQRPDYTATLVTRR